MIRGIYKERYNGCGFRVKKVRICVHLQLQRFLLNNLPKYKENNLSHEEKIKNYKNDIFNTSS